MATKGRTANTTHAPSPRAPATETRAVNSTAVDMISEDGVLKVPVQINGAISLKFVVDSGASVVVIPKDVFLTLQRTGSITESDYLPDATFTMANGSQEKQRKFIMRSIKVGESTVSDVVATVGPASASLLLGQSFLSKYKEWKIDNKMAQLILTGGVPQAPVALEALEISKYMPPLPLGIAMENAEQSLARTRARELEAMRKDRNTRPLCCRQSYSRSACRSSGPEGRVGFGIGRGIPVSRLHRRQRPREAWYDVVFGSAQCRECRPAF